MKYQTVRPDFVAEEDRRQSRLKEEERFTASRRSEIIKRMTSGDVSKWDECVRRQYARVENQIAFKLRGMQPGQNFDVIEVIRSTAGIGGQSWCMPLNDSSLCKLGEQGPDWVSEDPVSEICWDRLSFGYLEQVVNMVCYMLAWKRFLVKEGFPDPYVGIRYVHGKPFYHPDSSSAWVSLVIRFVCK